MKYIVEFTEKQLLTTAEALEFYSRFLAGQWEIPDAMVNKEYHNQNKCEDFYEKKHFIQSQLNVLKSQFTGLSINSSYGIGEDKLSDKSCISYDIYRPIYEEFNKNTNNVYSFPSHPYSVEGRIKIKKDYDSNNKK